MLAVTAQRQARPVQIRILWGEDDGLGSKLKVKDYYQVLGVTPRSHARAIEERYWEQAHELHNEPTRRAVKRLRLINEAYETLGSPYRREHYDKQRAQMVSVDDVRDGPHLLQMVLSVLSKPFRPD
jgi:curved DNA-binding protein CbpA